MNQNDKNNLINDADDAAFRQAVQRKSGKKLASAPLSKEAKARRKKKKLILGITIPLGIIVLFGALYATFVFSSIPFVKYWRTIYIETAMSTGHHHWLAEKFIPADIIKEVMDEKERQDKDNINVIGGDIEPADSSADTTAPEPKKPVDILGQRDLREGDTDYAGYTVLVNDTEECLVISEIVGTGYRGKIMLIDDPARVWVGSIPDSQKGKEGLRIKDMLKYHNAVAGINASGFNDPLENGLGGEPVGMSCSNGEFWGSYVTYYGSIVLTTTNKLVVGKIDIWKDYNIRDGIQFGPVLIANGETKVTGSAGYGMHPRTAIGQRADGVIAFLVIDGRSTTSMGCTVGELANILQKYNIVNAACCDGGASSLIAYNGEIITNNSSYNPSYGRLLPNAFLVKHKADS